MRLYEHVATGVVFGFLMGCAYFVLEPVMLFWGKLSYLDVSLLRLFTIYAGYGIVVGVTLSAVAGGFTSILRWRIRRGKWLAFYATSLTGMLVLAVRYRDWTLVEFKAISGGELVIVLALVVGLAVIAFPLGRLLSRTRLVRLGSGPAVVLSVIGLIVVIASHLVARAGEMRVPLRTESADGRPNIVFLLLDALRPDHMSAYGYDRETTPNLDRLAKEGVVFANARSHGNRTILSMPAVFTSLYPSFNGALGRKQIMRPLPEKWTTIAEMLQQRDYTTVGIMSNVYVKSVFGMTQGFDKTEEFLRGRYQLGLMKLLRKLGVVPSPGFLSASPSATEVTDAALQWLHTVEDRPFFLYVHYMDTHHPYVPPPPFDTMFGDGVPEPAPAALFHKTVALLKEPPPLSLDERELQKLKDYYDGRIRYTDKEIGRLIDEIVALSDERETIVIMTADHGDEFLEHGSFYHNNLLIEELIHVPLIIWAPKRFAGGQEIEPLVRHIDLMPTIADMTGAEVPDQAMGTSLVPLMAGRASDLDLASFAEGDFCVSLSHDDWKVMYVDSTETYHLYDLASEEGEYKDVSGTRGAMMEKMRARLDEYLIEIDTIEHKRTQELLDPELIKELRDLGYL